MLENTYCISMYFRKAGVVIFKKELKKNTGAHGPTPKLESVEAHRPPESFSVRPKLTKCLTSVYHKARVYPRLNPVRRTSWLPKKKFT